MTLPLAMQEHGAAIAALKGCRACALPPASYPVVAAYTGQRVLLVGQAPGKEELAQNRPFAGAAGRTLFRWFAEAGLGDEAAVRARIYFSAVAHCWPGSREGSTDDLPPTPAMRAACRGHLAAEAALVAPRLVVAVGALGAAEVLGRRMPLSLAVGPVHRVAWLGATRSVVVLPHPSGLSRWLNDLDHRRRHAEVLAQLKTVINSPLAA